MFELETYTATYLDSNIFTDGTTRPIRAIAENGKQYVLKLFSSKDAEQRCYTGAELYSYYLAKKFDMPIPNGVLIHIPIELINIYKKTDKIFYDFLISKDINRHCFATEYLGKLPNFSPAIHKKFIEIHEIASLFAFDMMILNEDRKAIKPNLLKKNTSFYLIDHDKAFCGIDYCVKLMKNNSLPIYSKNHIFYKLLKKFAKQNGTHDIFDTFDFYLSDLNVGGLSVLSNKLLTLNYQIDECLIWEDYICYIKENRNLFIHLLKKSLIE